MDSKKRTIKILYIDKRDVFNLAVSLWSYDAIRLPDFTGLLPKDYSVRDVYYEPSRDAFGFVIFSSEYEPVEPGHPIPVIINRERGFHVINLSEIRKGQKAEGFIAAGPFGVSGR